MTKVSVIECKDYSEVKKAVKKSLDSLGGLEKFVKKGDKVLLKPNLSDPVPPEKVAVTHPLLVRAVIELVKEITPIVWVAEQSASTQREVTMKAFIASGLKKVIDETGATLRNIALEQFIPYDIPKYSVLERTDFARSLIEADVVINLPKLKSHGITYITGAVKNLFGCVHPDERQYLHREFPDRKDFSKGIVDVFSFLKPNLNVMDAVIGMEGNEGPSYGKPVKIGYIITSEDAVAVDAVAAKLTGHNPLSIITTKNAHKRKLGQGDFGKIEILGDFQEIQFDQHSNYRNRNQELNVQPRITEKCQKCGACFHNCPVNAISKIKGKYIIDENKCIKCYCCVESCIYDAIELNEQSTGADLIRLGLTCNQSCIFCTAFSKKPTDLSTSEIKKEIDFLSKKGCGKLAFTGGEPTLRKDIVQLVKHAKKAGIEKVEIQTNGVLLADNKKTKELVKAGVDHFFISIHSHKKDIYKKITKTDKLKDALKGLENVTKENVSLQICHVINTLNFKEAINFTQFISKKFGKISMYYGFIRPNKELGNDKKIVPKLVDVELDLYRLFDYCRSNSIYFEVEGVPLCYMQGYETHNIEAKRLLSSSKYHVEKDSVKSDTHKEHTDTNKASGESCEACPLSDICPKVWKEYDNLYGTEELFPIFDRGIIEKIKNG